MSQRRSLYRKVSYMVAMAILVFPLYWLSSPTVSGRNAPDGKGRPGGRLAQLRTEYGLSQANLGEIDPASETIRLVTLGMRGVATNLLWEKANHYKKVEDWTNLSVTLEQIAKLQPNFISVWRHQAWNLSYNVSVQFDDYRDRYYYVIRGIHFLKEGIKYNEDHPDLLSDLGWFIGNKLGRADEHVQFRRLFKEDDDFHPDDRHREDRDNWLVAHEWYLLAEYAVRNKGKPLRRPNGRGKSELLFYAQTPMTLMNHAEAMQEDGLHGSVAGTKWKDAGREWYKYGNEDIPHSTGMLFRLNEQERMLADAEKHQVALDALVPDLRDNIYQGRLLQLTPEKRQALDTPTNERTTEQIQLAAEAESEIEVSHDDLVLRIASVAPEKHAEARRLVTAADKAELRSRYINNYRDIVNYLYWRTRAQFEQTPEALVAHELVYEADRALDEADIIVAQKKYERALAHWRTVIDNFPRIKEDSVTGDNLMDIVKRYHRLLSELNESFPEDFPLWDLLEQYDREGSFREEIESHRRAVGDEDSSGQGNPS